MTKFATVRFQFPTPRTTPLGRGCIDLVVSQQRLLEVRAAPSVHDIDCPACGGYGGESTSEGPVPCEWCVGYGTLPPEIESCVRAWLLETSDRTHGMWKLP